MTTNFATAAICSRAIGCLGTACVLLLASTSVSANLLSLSFDGNVSPGAIYEKDGCKTLEGGLADHPCARFVPGKDGQAIELGKYAVVAAPVNLDPHLTPQITFTAWIKGSGRGGYLLSDGGFGGLPHLFLYGGALAISAGRSTIRYPDQIPAMPRDEWVFVAGVWDYTNQTMRLHQDEAHQEFSGMKMDLDPAKRLVLAETPLWAPPDNPSAKDHYIFVGAQNFKSFGQTAINFAMDDVRLYPKALSVAEVDAIREEKTGTPYAVAQAPAFDPAQRIRDSATQVLSSSGTGDNGATTPPVGASTSIESPLPAASRDALVPQSGPSGTTTESTASSGTPTQAAGTEGLFTNRNALSGEATSSLQEAASENAPLEMTYASEEEALAAQQAAEERRQREAYQEDLSRQQNELEQQRRDEASAAAGAEVDSTPAVYGPGGDYVLSGVSGYSGGERIRLDHVTRFIDRITWAEENNRPCLLADFAGSERLEFKKCQRTFALFDSWPDHKTVGGLGRIRSLRVCNNNNDNKRLKGIQIWGATIDGNGKRVDQPESTYESNANCATWGSVVRCPSGRLATGLLIHANDASRNGKQIVGLELICRAITQTN